MVNHPEEINTEINHFDEASRVGGGLRQVREQLGWKLTDVAERIRIRAVFLVAIETGDLSALPGTAYRVGFVRAYAQALGLDGEEILQRFRHAGQIGEPEKNEIKLLAPVPNRGVPKGAVIFIAFIIAVGGYGFWYHHTAQTRKLAQSALQIPTKLQPLTTPPKIVQPATQASATPAAASSAPAPVKPATPTPQTPATSAPSTASASALSTAAAPVADAAASSAAVPATSSNQNSPNPPSPAPASAPAPAAGMVITATQPAWVQVTEANGTILFSKVLNAGQSWPVPQMPGLKMTTGNAGGTMITTDGKAAQPLGADGVVLRGYQLTPPAPNSAAPAPSSTNAASSP